MRTVTIFLLFLNTSCISRTFKLSETRLHRDKERLLSPCYHPVSHTKCCYTIRNLRLLLQNLLVYPALPRWSRLHPVPRCGRADAMLSPTSIPLARRWCTSNIISAPLNYHDQNFRLICGETRPYKRFLSSTSFQGSSGLVPQDVDLLEAYRGLAALGKVQFDEDQVRVIMEVRVFV